MGRFSGKCDIMDDMFLTCLSKGLKQEKDESDLAYELRCFDLYKKLIHGKIYRSFKMELNIFNIDDEIKRVNNPKLLRKEVTTKTIKDRRCKSGERLVEHIDYYYYDRKYTKLYNIDYYAKEEIEINDILDLIPYYVYVPGVVASSPDGIYIQVGEESYLDEKYRSFRESGIDTEYILKQKKKLKAHYVSMALYLFDNRYKELVNEVSKSLEKEVDNARDTYEDALYSFTKDEFTTSYIEDYQYSSGYFEAMSKASNIVKASLEKVN